MGEKDFSPDVRLAAAAATNSLIESAPAAASEARKQLSYDVPLDACGLICRSSQASAQSLKAEHRGADRNGGLSTTERAMRVAKLSLHLLLIAKAQSVCPDAPADLDQVLPLVLDPGSPFAVATEFFRAKPDEAGTQSVAAQSSLEGWGRMYGDLALRELLKLDLPSKQRAEIAKLQAGNEQMLQAYFRFAEASLNGLEGSLFNTFMVAAASLQDEKGLLQPLLDRAATKDPLNVLYGPKGGDTGPRGSIGRIVPFHLARWLRDPTEGGRDQLFKAIVRMDEYLADLSLEFARDGVHDRASKAHNAPYYLIPALAYLGSSIEILELTDLSDEQKNILASARRKARGVLARHMSDKGLMGTHPATEVGWMGGQVWGNFNDYTVPMAGLAAFGLLQEQDACYRAAVRNGHSMGIAQGAKVFDHQVSELKGTSRRATSKSHGEAK
jgi:hypothetical protein